MTKKYMFPGYGYKYKILFSFFLFAIVVLSIITIVHIQYSKENNLIKFNMESKLQSKEKNIFFKTFLERKKDSLIAVRDNPYFIELVENGRYPHNTDFLFFTIMQENKDFAQLKFLDNKGIERLRFDREYYGGFSYKVDAFEDKSNKYYFKKTINLKQDTIFLSKIDSYHNNHSKIDASIIRVSTPVYASGKVKGVLVISIFIDDFLKLLTQSPIYEIVILDNNGYLIDNKYSHNTEHISDLYDKYVVKKILSTLQNTTIFNEKLYVEKVVLINRSFYFLYKTKEFMLAKIRKDEINMSIVILIFTLLVSIPFTFLVAYPIRNMFEKLLKENILKDRLFQHQSKQAELGDIISNIAHQWRHPLTKVSLLLQNLKLLKNKNKMSDEVFFSYLEKSSFQIDFMSETIDNFMDFYRTDKEKSYFEIQDSIDSVLKIIGSSLKHDSIDLVTKNNQNISLYGIKNQFSQVLLNLIVNAKDALSENNIENKTINIEVYKNNNKHIITIEDNAGGIAVNIINKIFSQYFTTKNNKGTGIGLYLCSTIIKNDMNGDITVKNTSKGALFEMVFNS